MAYRLTPEDLQVMEAAARIGTGGMSAFTSYYFAPIHGTPRWDLVATSPDTWDLAEGEFVPWVPLAWQMAVAHDKWLDATSIAGFGSGKTVGIGAVFTYWCCMIPNLTAMDAAPVGWQARQMYDAIRQELADYDNRHERPTRLSRLITRVVEKPYPMRHARENSLRGYYVEEAQRAGTVLWVMPPNEFDRYVLIGDPGQNTPPDRNSGVVVVLKVTGFPQVPAEVAAFHWVDGQGSYWPFINQMEEWYRAYRPIYTAFDASGTQKGFDELVFAVPVHRGGRAEPPFHH